MHRGFHSVDDRSSRPIENSLSSFEASFTNGFKLAECDVALTVDGHVVLCHDASFSRLALCAAGDGVTAKNVSEMTLRELMGLQLRTGTRPPLLSDVLESTSRIGEGAKMVVEIKPGNSEMSRALCELFKEVRPRAMRAQRRSVLLRRKRADERASEASAKRARASGASAKKAHASAAESGSLSECNKECSSAAEAG